MPNSLSPGKLNDINISRTLALILNNYYTFNIRWNINYEKVLL